MHTRRRSSLKLRQLTQLSRWLNAQIDALSSPELQRLRAAFVVLSLKPSYTKQRDVRSLCWSWGVHRYKERQNRPIVTLVAELQEAVIFEGTKLCGRGSEGQTRLSTSKSAPPAEPDLGSALSSCASESSDLGNAEQRATTYHSIADVNRWLKGLVAESSAPDLQKVSASVVVLSKMPKP